MRVKVNIKGLTFLPGQPHGKEIGVTIHNLDEYLRVSLTQQRDKERKRERENDLERRSNVRSVLCVFLQPLCSWSWTGHWRQGFLDKWRLSGRVLAPSSRSALSRCSTRTRSAIDLRR